MVTLGYLATIGMKYRSGVRRITWLGAPLCEERAELSECPQRGLWTPRECEAAIQVSRRWRARPLFPQRTGVALATAA